MQIENSNLQTQIARQPIPPAQFSFCNFRVSPLRNIDSQMSETSANSDPACDHRCVAEKLYHRQSKVFQLTETLSFPDLSYPLVFTPYLHEQQRCTFLMHTLRC